MMGLFTFYGSFPQLILVADIGFEPMLPFRRVRVSNPLQSASLPIRYKFGETPWNRTKLIQVKSLLPSAGRPTSQCGAIKS